MAVRINARNERLKHEYTDYLHHVRGYSEATVDGVLKSIRRYEDYTGGKDFKQFSRNLATGFCEALKKSPNARNTGTLSLGTVYSTVHQVKAFFVWLAGKPGYKSRISYSDTQYFGITDKEVRKAKAPRLERVPTIEQIHAVVTGIEIKSEIDRRDQALIAFALLTAARDGAICSAKIGHIDLAQSLFFQDGRDVATKNSKTIHTTFFPVGEPFLQIVKDWVNYLIKEKLYGLDAPLFPANKIESINGKGFQVTGLARKPWATATAMREIFKQRFTETNLPYYNPHSIRKTITRLGEQRCCTPEEFKAWSQNLGHENVATTFNSYGQVPTYRQAQLILGLAGNEATPG